MAYGIVLSLGSSSLKLKVPLKVPVVAVKLSLTLWGFSKISVGITELSVGVILKVWCNGVNKGSPVNLSLALFNRGPVAGCGSRSRIMAGEAGLRYLAPRTLSVCLGMPDL